MKPYYEFVKDYQDKDKALEKYKAYLRTELSAMAMQGLLSGATWENNGRFTVNDSYTNAVFIARESIEIADELIKQLKL